MKAAWRGQIALVAALPIFVLLLAFASGVLAQVSSIDEIEAELMRRVLPGASSFEPAESILPIYAGYAGSEPELVGYAFFTPDLPPEEIGYSAPIDMLVGMNTEGTVTGLEIVHYTESYKSIRGDFINTEGFPQQFSGMEISEGFRVGRNVDGISRATITAWAVARGIRNAARRVSLISPFRIKRVRQCLYCKVCEHSCPTGAIEGPKIDFKECVRCDDCESKLIHQAGRWKKSAQGSGIRN